jgi:hypothetical protein
MKKQLTILVLFFFNSTFAWSQTFVKTTTPCDKELLLKTPGEWLKTGYGYNATISKLQLQEIEKRLNVIHQWCYNIYPSPMAFDAKAFFETSERSFAMNHTLSYEYRAGFCAYNCGRTANEIMRGRGCETGTNLSVITNNLLSFFTNRANQDLEIMVIDGRPIKIMPVLKGKWKGYDLYTPKNGSGYRMVLLHRDGVLPYIPVTRQQYLDRSIKWLVQYFDDLLKAVENPEGLAALQDKKERDENIKKSKKYRDDVLKYYQDELDATTKAGLLDSPAVIFGGMVEMLTQYPIFMTQAEGGRLLVTENPAYMKKDLPKYIPQLIVYTMWNAEDGPDPALNPYHLYYKDFPVEKLKAMIDK